MKLDVTSCLKMRSERSALLTAVKHAVNISKYISSSDRMINKQRILNDVEGRGCGLIYYYGVRLEGLR
jgi:hypothetical protein